MEDGKAVHRVQRSCASYNNRHKTLWSLACFPQKPLAACVELTPAITCTKEHFLTMTVTTVCMWEDAVRTYCTCSRAWHDTSMCKWAGVMNRQSWSVSGLLVGVCTGLNTEPYAEPSKPRPTERGYMLSRAWMTCQWADSISWYWAIEIYRNRRIVVLIKSIWYRCVGAVPRARWLIFFRTIISTLLNRNSDGNHIWRKQLWLRALCIGLANGDQGLNPAWTVCLWFFIHSCFIFRSLYSFLLRFDSVYINKILGPA